MAEARQKARERVEAARAEIRAEAEAAREALRAEAERIAATIAQTVLAGRVQ